MQKKIFISYSDFDRGKMRLLEDTINMHKELLTPIIIADNRKALVQLTEKVSKGITDCDFLVPILTQNSINTQWINQEIGFAKALNKTKIPIVEDSVIDQLKGFVHKQLDLSYSFESYPSHRTTESKRFKTSTLILINDLVGEISKSDYKQNNINVVDKISESTKSPKGNTIESDKIYNAIPNFNSTISNSILDSESGTISIWAFVNDLHNIISPTSKYKYLLSFATNNGKKLNNPSLADYPNAWSISRVTPTNTNHFGYWRFWCNNVGKETVDIRYEKPLQSGWHLFSVCWSRDDNNIIFLIDGEIVGKSEFRNWPSDLTGSFYLGRWPDTSPVHYFDSKIGPYQFRYEGYNEKNIKEMLRNKPK